MFYLAVRDSSKLTDDDRKNLVLWKEWQLEELPPQDGRMTAYISSRLPDLKEKKLIWFCVLRHTFHHETNWYVIDTTGNQHPAIATGKAHTHVYKTQSQNRV